MLTVQANTIVDDKHTLAKAQAEIQRLKGLLSKALKQVESNEDGSEKVGFAKLMAENEKLKQENKSLRSAVAQLQQRSQSSGKRSSALGVLLEEDDLELNGEDYNSPIKSEGGSQLSRHHSNSKKKQAGVRNSQGRATSEAYYSASADNAHTTNPSSTAAVDRSSESFSHRNLKAASSSLHSLVTFSYFDQQQQQNKGSSSHMGIGEFLFDLMFCFESIIVTFFLLCLRSMSLQESERDDATTASKRFYKRSLPPMPLDGGAVGGVGSGDSQQKQQSILRQEEQLQIQLYRQMKDQEQTMMMRDSASNVSHVNSKVHSKLLRLAARKLLHSFILSLCLTQPHKFSPL